MRYLVIYIIVIRPMLFEFCIYMVNWQGAEKGSDLVNTTKCYVCTEYHEMGVGSVKAIVGYKAYIVVEILDLLRYVAPKLMARGGAHFSYGIGDNLEDPKYQHYKYWSNPLET